MFELCILFSLVAISVGIVATVKSHIPPLGKLAVVALLVLFLIGVIKSPDEPSAQLCAFVGVIIAMIAAIAKWHDGAKPYVIAFVGILLAWFLIHDLHLRDFYTPHTPRPISHAPDFQPEPADDSAPVQMNRSRSGGNHRGPSQAECDKIGGGRFYKKAAGCRVD